MRESIIVVLVAFIAFFIGGAVGHQTGKDQERTLCSTITPTNTICVNSDGSSYFKTIVPKVSRKATPKALKLL